MYRHMQIIFDIVSVDFLDMSCEREFIDVWLPLELVSDSIVEIVIALTFDFRIWLQGTSAWLTERWEISFTFSHSR